MVSEVVDIVAADLIICARWVVTMNAEHSPDDSTVIPFGAVVIQNDRIVEVTKTDDIRMRLANGKLTAKSFQWAGPNSVLLPGLINMHCHAAMSLLRGFADDFSLDVWLRSFVFPVEGKLLSEYKDDYIRIGTRLAARELALLGTTTVMDMYYGEDLGSAEFRNAGLRCVHTHTITNVGQGHEAVMKEVEDAIEYCKVDDDAYLQHAFSLHAMYTTEPKYYREIGEANKSLKKLIFSHLNETESEDFKCKEKSDDGKTSAIDSLEQAGLLNQNFIGIHCVHLTDEQIQKLAKYNVNVCHCPRSNLKLGSGAARIRDLLNAGVNVCLGTDSACSNNSLDMLAEAQMAILMAKGFNKDPTNLTAYQVLCMATRNGAKALKRDHELGTLEKGKLADLISVDLGMIGLRPIYDVISEIVFTTTRKVENVWVGGKQIVSKGVCLTIDPLVDEGMQKLQETLKAFKVDLEVQRLRSIKDEETPQSSVTTVDTPIQTPRYQAPDDPIYDRIIDSQPSPALIEMTKSRR